MVTHQSRFGKFIVIDGTDGAGKATQSNLLFERLKRENYAVQLMDFPQFGKKSCGPAEEYLNGKYGSSEEVGPYKASILYAVDRFDASFEIRDALSKGVNIISNRYVSSNIGYQASKIKNKLERKKFIHWLYDLEYKKFQIPKPDINLILHVSSELAYKLVEHKRPRKYLTDKRKKDIHEEDIRHIIDAEKTYLDIAKNFSGFKLIECMRDKEILSVDEIHALIWEEVTKILNKKLAIDCH